MTLSIVELADKVSDSANAKLFTKLGWLEAIRALREYYGLSDPEIEAWMRSQHPQLACDHSLHICNNLLGDHYKDIIPVRILDTLSSREILDWANKTYPSIKGVFEGSVISSYISDHPYVIDHDTLNELMLYHWLSHCTGTNFMLGYITISILTMALFLFGISQN